MNKSILAAKAANRKISLPHREWCPVHALPGKIRAQECEPALQGTFGKSFLLHIQTIMQEHKVFLQRPLYSAPCSLA